MVNDRANGYLKTDDIVAIYLGESEYWRYAQEIIAANGLDRKEFNEYMGFPVFRVNRDSCMRVA